MIVVYPRKRVKRGVDLPGVYHDYSGRLAKTNLNRHFLAKLRRTLLWVLEIAGRWEHCLRVTLSDAGQQPSLNWSMLTRDGPQVDWVLADWR